MHKLLCAHATSSIQKNSFTLVDHPTFHLMAVLNTAAGAELAADELDAITDAVGGGGGHSSSSKCMSFSCARAMVCRLKLCNTKVWTLATVSWIEICEFKVNKIIVI